MPAQPPARLLDLTRSVSRIGLGPPTGVDRVEMAYMARLQADPAPLFALVKLAAGFAVLDRAGIAVVASMVSGLAVPGPPDLLARLVNRGAPTRAAIETQLRRVALWQGLSVFLARGLRQHLPNGFHYLNVGHSNLSDMTMRAVRRGGAVRIGVLVHDVIPLLHPEFTRPGIPTVFARKMRAMSGHADLVIHSTNAARKQTEAAFARFGRTPQGLTMPLGVPALPVVAGPSKMDLTAPYFVTLGTIEPRKNHALLMDIWEQAHPPARLLVIGRRGWADPALFARIDRHGQVQEMSGLKDTDMAGILAGAQALLFPTFAEGFGLPPVEAASLGVPVLCSDLPVLREVLGDYPVYLNPADPYSWTKAILDHAVGAARTKVPRPGLGWDDHFQAVLAGI